MANQRKYLLDANVFIEAHRRYYGFDLCPGFWTAIVQQHGQNRVFSIDRVKQEIARGKDELVEWVDSHAPDTFFKTTDSQSIIEKFSAMFKWAQDESQYTLEAKAKFASDADGWLVACAKTEGLVVVTHEVFIPDVKVRVPIPNVCRTFKVEYVTTFTMLRDLRIQFCLRKHTP